MYSSFPCKNSTIITKNVNMFLKMKFTSRKWKISFAVLKDINFNSLLELLWKCAAPFAPFVAKINYVEPFADNVEIIYFALTAALHPVKKENVPSVIKWNSGKLQMCPTLAIFAE